MQSKVSESILASDACLMVFTQVPAHTGSDALLSTTATGLPLPANRDLTPSTPSEGGSEDTGALTLLRVINNKLTSPSQSRSHAICNI